MQPILVETKKWLDLYFKGEQPDPKQLSFDLKGSNFQKTVWEILLKIPYGETRTYGSIAIEIADKSNLMKMSSQAVGQAISLNPIPIIVPCHRVVGANRNLTGFALGLKTKAFLLEHEGIDIKNYLFPRKYKY